MALRRERSRSICGEREQTKLASYRPAQACKPPLPTPNFEQSTNFPVFASNHLGSHTRAYAPSFPLFAREASRVASTELLGRDARAHGNKETYVGTATTSKSVSGLGPRLRSSAPRPIDFPHPGAPALPGSRRLRGSSGGPPTCGVSTARRCSPPPPPTGSPS